MKFELLLLGITAFLVANVYHDGKYLKMVVSWKKYYQMALICFISLSFYMFVKRHPKNTGELIRHSNEFIKYMPMDREASSFITPILDFTSRSQMFGEEYISPQQRRMMQSGGTNNDGLVPVKTKRSVSETKKKYVASQQDWKCGHCSNTLSAWFEVDHKIGLEHGGSNHVSNLVALCRECHGEKTGMENL